MMIRYVLLAMAFLIGVIGGALGASTNDANLMVLGICPGLASIFALMFAYRG